MEHSASGEGVQITIAVGGKTWVCGAVRMRTGKKFNKCGCGADSGQKLTMWCGWQTQLYCPCHL